MKVGEAYIIDLLYIEKPSETNCVKEVQYIVIVYKSLKTLFNIVENDLKKLLNFDVSAV